MRRVRWVRGLRARAAGLAARADAEGADTMTPARLGTLVMGMVALAAAGCASTAEPDEVQLKIQDYYAAQAT